MKMPANSVSFCGVIFLDLILLFSARGFQGSGVLFLALKSDCFFKIEILPAFHNGGRTGEYHKTKRKHYE
jgi:hypothetical protein